MISVNPDPNSQVERPDQNPQSVIIPPVPSISNINGQAIPQALLDPLRLLLGLPYSFGEITEAISALLC